MDNPNANFVAVDFETATEAYNSACAIGIVRVQNGEIVDRFYSLIQPPGSKYSVANIEVHGITPEMTQDSPTFAELWDQIAHYFSGDMVVAHNASFDMHVLKASLADIGLPDFRYMDSMAVAKKILSGSCTLENCTLRFRIPFQNHHNALADAEACALIFLRCLACMRCERPEDLIEEIPALKIENFNEVSDKKRVSFGRKTPLPSYSNLNLSAFTPAVSAASPSGPLCGKVIVFTGDLHLDRSQAWQLSLDCGAVVKNGVTQKTDILVVGKQDLYLVGADGMSSKEEKAYALNAAGRAHIEIIDERAFLDLLRQSGIDI